MEDDARMGIPSSWPPPLTTREASCPLWLAAERRESLYKPLLVQQCASEKGTQNFHQLNCLPPDLFDGLEVLSLQAHGWLTY